MSEEKRREMIGLVRRAPQPKRATIRRASPSPLEPSSLATSTNAAE